eukprot:13879553-Ditylum_brightwellii.AAC.1
MCCDCFVLFSVLCLNFSSLSQNEEYTTISLFNHHKKEKKVLSPGIRGKEGCVALELPPHTQSMLSRAALRLCFSSLSKVEEYTPISRFNHHNNKKKGLSPGIRGKEGCVAI